MDDCLIVNKRTIWTYYLLKRIFYLTKLLMIIKSKFIKDYIHLCESIPFMITINHIDAKLPCDAKGFSVPSLNKY